MDYDDLPDDRVLISMATDDSFDIERSFPELDEMLLDDPEDEGRAPGPAGTPAFMPFIRTVQRIVLYETKAV